MQYPGKKSTFRRIVDGSGFTGYIPGMNYLYGKTGKTSIRSALRILMCCIALAGAGLLSGCSSRQEISITRSGAGSALVEVDIHPVFIEYMKDVMEGVSGRPAGPDFRIFDVHRIREAFLDIDEVVLKEVRSDGAGSLLIEMDFTDPGLLFGKIRSSSAPGIVGFESRGNRRILSLHLRTENFGDLFAFSGMESSGPAEVFGPQPDPYSKGEYIEMMEFALGDYAVDEPVASILRRRNITARIRTDGPVLSVRGGTFSGDTAVIEIPLLEVLTLEKPVEVSIEWEPR